MITVHLNGQSEKIAPTNPWPSMTYPPLYHQWRTYAALQEPDVQLVVNSHNTGTGKTRASLLRLFDLSERRGNVLFVAPTNALLTQHEADIREFVKTHQLNFVVRRINAQVTRELSRWQQAQGNYNSMRPAEALMRMIRNYREYETEATARQGLILVVNPDIFYYALMFQYGTNDQRNLFEQFLTTFEYIIIDEFHYYDQKQVGFFLFFFAISQQLGFFNHKTHPRKICLLSATPTPTVTHYLQKLFNEKWRLIAPETEPLDSVDFPTIPTLTPLTLKLINQPLLEWGEQHATYLKQAITQDARDGAIISNSLKRINRLYATLRHTLSDSTMRRITGPEPEAARQSATLVPLILATPTVDIGYNFNKPNKTRQNIDFIVCEAQFRDELVQRIGRAGRILGATETDGHSDSVVLLSDAAIDPFRAVADQTLSRADFKQLLTTIDTLPEKHNLYGYLKTWAITELFYPLYRIERLIAHDPTLAALDALYTQLLNLVEVRPSHNSQKWQLESYFRKFYYREQWLKAKAIEPSSQTAQHISDWFFHKEGDESRIEARDLLPIINQFLDDPAEVAALRRFVQSQVALSKSLFNFRDSFDGPTAVVYDEQQRFSSELIATYDVLHLVSDYNIFWYDSRAAFAREHGETNKQGVFFGRIIQHRTQPLTLTLHHNARETLKEEFEKQWTCRPVALDQFELRATASKQAFNLDSRIRDAIYDQFVTMLIIPATLGGFVWRRLGQSPLYSRQLTINFADQGQVDYLVFLGKAAWLAYPELRYTFKLAERMQDNSIII